MDEIKKIYWSMKDVIHLLNQPGYTIRFWCKEFNINPRRDGHKNRMFTEKELGKLFQILNLLKMEKFTIKGAKQKMNIIKLPIKADQP